MSVKIRLSCPYYSPGIIDELFMYDFTILSEMGTCTCSELARAPMSANLSAILFPSCPRCAFI